MKFIYNLICLAATLAAPIVLFWNPEWICRIHGDVSYVWYDGIWHGFWAVIHFIRDIFTNTKCISHHGSVMYYVCYWATLVLTYIVGFVCRIFRSDSRDVVSSPEVSEEEKRLQRLASTKEERMHKALTKRVSMWFGDIQSNSGKSAQDSSSAVAADKTKDLSALIASQIMDFVVKKLEEKCPLDELNVKELHESLSSTLFEYKIVCEDNEIDALIDMALAYIKESIKAFQEIYG